MDPVHRLGEPLPKAAAIGRGRRPHDHGHHVLHRVDEEARSGRAVPPVRALADREGRRVGVHDHAEAQRPAPAGLRVAETDGQQSVGDAIDGHQCDGGRLENPHAVELAAVEEHLREPQVVPDGRHQPDAPLDQRRLFGERNHLYGVGAQPAVGTGPVGGAEAVGAGRVDAEHRVGHAERLEHTRCWRKSWNGMPDQTSTRRPRMVVEMP